MSGRALLGLGAGFAVWASAFVALYAMLSVGCRFGWEGVELLPGLSAQRAQLILLLALHLGVGAVLAVRFRVPPHGPFLWRLSYLAAVAALAASLFTFAGVLVLSSCA